MRDKKSINTLRLSAAMAAGCLIGSSSILGNGLNEPIAIPPERKDWPKHEDEPSPSLKERRKLLAKKLREK